MRNRPTDLDELRLVERVTNGWGVPVVSVEYFPEGSGSHHWVAVDETRNRYFVTVDDLDNKDWLGHARDEAFDGLDRALRTSRMLHHVAGLEFVVAPVLDPGGQLLRRLDSRYALSVFPFLEGRSFAFGPYSDPSLRSQAMDLIIALHGATGAVRDSAPHHVPRYTAQTSLKRLLAQPEQPWGAGPFSQGARDLLSNHISEIVRLIEGYDMLAFLTAPMRMDPVITHGEPHPANLLAVEGRLVLIDWDTVALAPPERDLSLLIPAFGDDLLRYEQATGRPVHVPVVTLYRLRWYLDDLSSAIQMVSRSHEDSPDTRRWWEGLAPSLQELPIRLEQLGQALRAADR